MRSIAWQLSTQLPEYGDRLCAIADLETVCRESNAQTLFDRLVVQPLHTGFTPPDRTIIVLIDGLDEATVDGRNELAAFLGRHAANLPDWMRLVITSRPETEVMQPLQGLTPLVLNAGSEENMCDIREFVERELAAISPGGLAPVKAVDTILERSEGVFLYAEWVRREIAEGRLSLDRPDQFPTGLGGVYDDFFRRRFPDSAVFRARFRPVLELLAVSCEPLSPAYMGTILEWSDYDCDEIPEAFGALLSSDSGLRPFHRTLVDWFTDRAKSGHYYANPAEGDKRLALHGWNEYQSGLDAMSGYMKAWLPRHLLRCKMHDGVVRLLGMWGTLSSCG